MSSSLTIRRDDALGAAARDLIARSEAELAGLYPPEHRFGFAPDALIAARTAFVTAWEDDRAIGCGGLAPYDDHGELKRLYVRPEARGKGVADAILAALEGIARQSGLSLLRLETGRDSPAALGLYARHGYRPCPAFGSYQDNGSSVFLEKRL